MSRDEEIQIMLGGDKIWPPNVISENRTRFRAALIEVLRRLPDNAFDYVERSVGFVVDELQFRAISVPYDRPIPPVTDWSEIRVEQIVIFDRAFALTDQGLVGLLAHEIAHCLDPRDDDRESEDGADNLARKWGFEKELKALRQ